MLNARDHIGQSSDDAPVEPVSGQVPQAGDPVLAGSPDAAPSESQQPLLSEKVCKDLAGVKSRIEKRLETADLTPDLAQDIGSGRWFRGIGTLFGLGLVSLSDRPHPALGQHQQDQHGDEH
ncbi:MAG: hypothetical protein P8J20_16590, partial [Novosphingobium sp.]|nr:hypothetical protein [Novosphingobium sp.]